MNAHKKSYHRSAHKQYLVKPLYSLSNFSFDKYILLTVGPLFGSEQNLLLWDSNVLMIAW